MALGNPDGAPHTAGAPALQWSAISQREIYVWLACILFASQILLPQGRGPEASLQFAQLLLSRSIFFYLGWYVVISLLFARRPDQAASRWDVFVALAGALLNLLPAFSSTWLAATVVGLLVLLSRHSDDKLRAAATVLLAISFNGYWGPKLFAVFGYYILRADAALVGAVLVATQPGMDWYETVVGRPGGHSLLIYNPCSSFHNVSLGLLCWISITKLVRARWAPGDLGVALAVCATVILFNATRLYLMALSSDHYDYWHGGTGEQLITLASTTIVLLMSLWGAVRLGSPK